MNIGRNDLCPCGSGRKYKHCCLNKTASPQIPSKHYYQLKGKRAEDVVHNLASKTFLADWCYLNPELQKGKELCDLLVVFDNVAIIWQIKDLKLDANAKYKKSEVDKNLRQLSGAHRQLFSLKNPIELSNPRRGKELFDPTTIQEIHLISALLGEGEEVFSFVENIKEHAIHVFNRSFTEIILNELDTVRDFTEYLRSKEDLIRRNQGITIFGGEEELLAIYLRNNRSFEIFSEADEATEIIIDEGSWLEINEKPEFIAKKKKDEISYLWDSIINRAHEGGEDYELVARELARTNRFRRRMLSKAFFDASIRANEDNRSPAFRRFLPGNKTDGITHCFLFEDIQEGDKIQRENRMARLATMSWIARGSFKQNTKVIGIATEKKIRSRKSYDFCLLDIPSWSEDDQKEMEKIKKEHGILLNPAQFMVHEDEYPEITEAK